MREAKSTAPLCPETQVGFDAFERQGLGFKGCSACLRLLDRHRWFSDRFPQPSVSAPKP